MITRGPKKYLRFDIAGFGTFCAVEENGTLTGLLLGSAAETCSQPQGETALLKKTETELREYFAGRRKNFDLPINPVGTVFQKKTWKILREIPYGTAISYAELARRIGQPKACRAVGNANGRNPLPIIIPCHRVIASDGSLGGYGGGTALKQKLLDLEKTQLLDRTTGVADKLPATDVKQPR